MRTLKLPLDLWIFQEIIHESKPDVIVEAGTFDGGSALYLATILDAIGKMVTTGNDLVAEDTNVNGHAVQPNFGPGPWEAAQTFLQEKDGFAVNVTCGPAGPRRRNGLAGAGVLTELSVRNYVRIDISIPSRVR